MWHLPSIRRTLRLTSFLLTRIITMNAIMLYSSIARSRSSSCSSLFFSASPRELYLWGNNFTFSTLLFCTLCEIRGYCWVTEQKTTLTSSLGTFTYQDFPYLSIISVGPWSMPIISLSVATASKNASSQNCIWSHSHDRSFPEYKYGGVVYFHNSKTSLISHYYTFVKIPCHNIKAPISHTYDVFKEIGLVALWAGDTGNCQ